MTNKQRVTTTNHEGGHTELVNVNVVGLESKDE